MMLDLGFIIKNSGDSILQNYSYSKGELIIYLDLDDLDKKILLRIKTDIIIFNSYYLDKKEDFFRTCRIEIQDLISVLPVENGVYIPPITFVKFMKEKKLNYNLAYGEKTASVKYICSLVGYDRLITCLVQDLDFIKFEEIN